MKLKIFTILLTLIYNVSISQEVGSKYQGGIVVAPGIILNPLKDYINPTYGKNLFSYKDAVLKCESLRTNGYNDWQVPSIVDLQNIHRFAEDNREWGGYPSPITPGFDYISSTTKKENDYFQKKTYRYFYNMFSDIKKLNAAQMELRPIDYKGKLIAIRYFR